MAYEKPYFAGFFAAHQTPEVRNIIPDGGEPLWEGESSFRAYGELTGELRTITHPLGHIAILGHCFAGEERIRSQFEEAVKKRDLSHLSHLPGGYSSLFLQPNKLVILGDLAGQFPIYFTQKGSDIFISSRASVVARAHGSQPNITRLALQIASPGTQEIALQQTHWQNVEQVPAGKSLELTRKGYRFSTYDTLAPNPETSFAEAAANLGKALDNGLETRAEIIGSTDFSGGFDSTALAFLRLRHASSPLHAYTHYDPTLPQGDLPYARQFAPLNSHLIPHELTTDNILPFQDLRQPVYSEEPQPLSLIAGARDEERYQHVHSMGSAAHLNGEGGDAILDVPGGQYLADLYSQHHFRRLLHESRVYARLANRSPLAVLRESAELAKSSLQQEFFQLAANLTSPNRPSKTSLRWLPHPGLSPLWLASDIREELAELASAHASGFILPENMSIADYSAVQSVRASGSIIRHGRQIADPYGVALHAPFLDHEVIRACLALPAHLRANPQTFKPILRKALAGMVPAEILSRQTKGDYTNGWYRGIRQSSVEIQRILNNSIMADLGIIKPEAVLNSLAHDLNTSSFPFVQFLHLMTAELWLRDLYKTDVSPLPTLHPTPTDTQSKDYPALAPPPETAHYVIPKNIRPIVGENGNMALFNIQTNQYSALNPTGRLLLEYLSEAGSLQSTVEILRSIYPSIPPQQLYADITTCIKELTARGILEQGHSLSGVSLSQTSLESLPRWDASLGQVQVAKGREAYSISWPDRARTLGAFSVALILRKRSFEVISETLEDIQKQLCVREATLHESEHAQAAVHQVTKRHFGRVACLELALTTAISLALQRRSVDFHIGAALDPLRFHAWVSVQSEPVTTPFDPPIAGVYQSLTSTHAE